MTVAMPALTKYQLSNLRGVRLPFLRQNQKEAMLPKKDTG